MGLHESYDYYLEYLAAEDAEEKKAILEKHFYHIIEAIWEMGRNLTVPHLQWLNVAQVQTPNLGDVFDSGLLFCGFPRLDSPGVFILPPNNSGWFAFSGGGTTMTLSNAIERWGSEKPSQWYAVYAKDMYWPIGSSIYYQFKAMPLMRYSSQAGQVITLRNNLNTANIGYGFVLDEFAAGLIYVLSGTSGGLTREITANNTDNDVGGTITYAGAGLTMSQGDWFMIIPPLNCRWVGNALNDPTSNLISFLQQGNEVIWTTPMTLTNPNGLTDLAGYIDPMATSMTIRLGAGAAGATPMEGAYVAHPDATSMRYPAPVTFGTVGSVPPVEVAVRGYGLIEVPVARAMAYFSGFSSISVEILKYRLPEGLRG